MRTECDKVLSVLLSAQIAPHCSSPSKNPCTEHQTHAALQTHVSMCCLNAMVIIIHDLMSFFMFTRITAMSGQFFGATPAVIHQPSPKKGKTGRRPE